ncbi:Crp/Fnr family transcriptional regulator [Granulicella tundricola]|uniref:Putative transcriptional regulator, Crp/Fnr family n=1 Tax=Granulicella tundricola (strain ATCC BAA-1859 / DSM 23138 / MP5ACTX9) TaxID=1198114 RepID=E8X6S0_GRATM|nr:Crp/Fnr family transcriptional regulator [Granulicella tundricola]ADW71220.1 putative transcriptional regulator, Crp/Fnr family [Granulicella tundricola MP5ACTX9]
MPGRFVERKGSSDRVVPAFSPAVDPATAELAGISEPRSYPAGSVLVEQGEHPRQVMLVRSGVVRLSFTNPKGDEILLGLRSEGWWAGGVLAVLNLPSLCTMETQTECLLSCFSPVQFCVELNQRPALQQHFMTSQCRELLTMQQHSILNGSSATERLKSLQDERTKSVWQTVDPTLILRQSEAARLLSITPEHLSRLKKRRRSDP